MKLSEKIMYYRKRAGMNQEALADKLGVSRQAVSKWETGEAVPELNKVVLLAKVFGVTTDALLLDDEETVDAAPEDAPSFASEAHSSSWVEAVPGVIGRLLRRYGWLSGVYLALSGAGMAAIGLLARTIAGNMMKDYSNALSSAMGGIGGLGGEIVYMNGEMVGQTTVLTASNPVVTLGGFLIGLGVVMMIGGAALAVVLKKKSK